MNSTYYSAASVECGCFLSCDDRHSTIAEAVGCIRRAGGYVVAVENGVTRALTCEEEAEFQSIVYKAVPPAPPRTRSPSASPPQRDPGETLVEFVLRLMSTYGFGLEKNSEVRLGSEDSAVRSIRTHDNARSTRDEQEPEAA